MIVIKPNTVNWRPKNLYSYPTRTLVATSRPVILRITPTTRASKPASTFFFSSGKIFGTGRLGGGKRSAALSSTISTSRRLEPQSPHDSVSSTLYPPHSGHRLKTIPPASCECCRDGLAGGKGLARLLRLGRKPLKPLRQAVDCSV